jgi:hypothetical protein
MTPNALELSSTLALALFTAQLNAPAPGVSDEPERPQALEPATRLELKLAAGSEQRYRIIRNDPMPERPEAGETDHPGGAVDVLSGIGLSLDLHLRVERVGEEDHLLTARLRSERSGESAWKLLVSKDGSIDGMQRLPGEEGREDGAAELAPELSEAALRPILGFVLGEGLQGQRLDQRVLHGPGASRFTRKGVREAAFAQQEEAAAPCSRLSDLAFRFQGIGAGNGQKLARFGLLLPREAGAGEGQGSQGDSAADLGTPSGDAAWSLEDGLLRRFSYRQRHEPAAEAETRPAEWLEIERVTD